MVYLENTLKRTPQTVNLESKEIVLNHFKINLRNPDNCAGFIQEGISQIQSDNCPFCGQKLSSDARKLLDAYSLYFDYSYAELQGEVTGLYDMLRSRSFETEFNDIKLKLAEHEKVAALWVPFLGEDFSKFTVTIDIEPFAKKLHDLQVDLLNQIDKKIKNIKLIPDINSANKIILIINEVNSSIQKLNLLCDEKNKTIEQYKNTIINEGDLSVLEQKLNQAENQLNRFTPKEKAWCKQYVDAKKTEEKAVSAYEDKKKELSEYSGNIFKKYEKEMNNILTIIGTNFRIDSFQGLSDRRTKSAFADFHISINNHPIGIGRSSQPIPCFSNTLSAGDKNALAFAFFVAGLKLNNSLENAIIVLDDPLNSLDDFRRSRTSQIIKELSDKPEQVIILTHKRDFLYMLDDNLKNPAAISIKADSNNGSRLTSFDIAEDRKLDHYKRIDRLRMYLSKDFGPEASEIQQDIRIALENALKFKYYEHLTSISSLGSMLDALAPLGKLKPGVLSQCWNLNNISSPRHHGEASQQQPLQRMERDELLPYVSETLEVLEKL
jgi:wobble nucleotide-excising tRNase